MTHSPDAPVPARGSGAPSQSAASPPSATPADRAPSGAAGAQPKGRWATEKIVVPLLQTIITGLVGIWLGWFLTGRVTNAIQQRQLELSHVKEMRDTFLRLEDVGTSPESAQADAFALAAFRDYAVVPLVLVLQNGDAGHVAAAENGLRAVALTDSALVARHMLRIIANRSRLYSWRAHLSAIRLLGDLDCRAARPALEAYRSEVGVANVDTALARLRQRVLDHPLPIDDDVATIKAQLSATLAALAPDAGAR